MRIGGLASGMDINQMVKDLMTAERIPMDKLFQKRQTLDWQRDAFRDINLSLLKFRDSYSKMRLQGTYSAYGVTSSNQSLLTATASTNAVPGSYDVTVEKIAKVAKLNSKDSIRNLNVSPAITGTGSLTSTDTAAQTITVTAADIANNDILTIDGETIQFYDSGAGGSADTINYDHQININGLTDDQIASAIAGLSLSTANVSLTVNTNQVTITAAAAGAAGNSISTSFNGAAPGISGTGNLTGGTDTGTITVSEVPKAGDILTINGETIEFYDSAEGAYSGSSTHAIDINSQTKEDIGAAIRGLTITDVTLGGAGDQVTVTTSVTGISTSYSANVGAKSSDKVLTPGDSETFTITNGQGLTSTITVDDTDTYATLAKKIANAADASGNSLGLRASFDDTTSRFFISSKEMGDDQGFTFQNTTFVQNQILGGGSNSTAGQSGKIIFDGITVDSLTSNNVTVQGLNLTLLQADAAKTITLTVNSDTDAAFDTIKEFVESYNELIAGIEEKLNEPKYRDYPPLTDEQRQALSEREAELWDEKAKSGLLRNDPILRSILVGLRRSLSDPVEGIPAGELSQLSEIGITTGNYRDGGKLFINEEKLRAVLADKPDEVMNLFTKTAETAGEKSQMGLGMRIFEDLSNSISRIRDKAGTSGVTLADQSVLGKDLNRVNDQISRWEDNLTRIEDRYWRQFTAMERALNQMNQQSMWMMQNMFGGTGGA